MRNMKYKAAHADVFDIPLYRTSFQSSCVKIYNSATGSWQSASHCRVSHGSATAEEVQPYMYFMLKVCVSHMLVFS